MNPSPAAREKATVLLSRALGDSKVLVDPDALERFAKDDSDVPGRVPDVVVLADGPDDIRRTLAVARETGVPVTPRAAGTGRTGGATPVHGGIVLSTLGMNRIVDIDRRERTVTVEPGVVLADLHRAVEAEGLFYPPDPNSLAACTIGGNLAENAGGPRAFKYGVTRDYVLGVEAYLMGGQSMFCGRRTVKGVTGYDVTSLLVGSEGTLALLGRATLRLVPKPPGVTTLLALFASSRDAISAVSQILAAGVTPRCIEFMDEGTLGALRAAGNAVSERAQSLLLIEVDGDEPSREGEVVRIGSALEDVGALDCVVAREGAQRERLWSARRDMSPAVRRMARNKLSEDVVVPRRELPELLDCVARETERSGIRTVSYGHAGDGNLHVNYLWNHEEERRDVEQSIERLFRDVVQLGGTLSGEHGIGLGKLKYMPDQFGAEGMAVMQSIKQALDPNNILNPGKLVGEVH